MQAVNFWDDIIYWLHGLEIQNVVWTNYAVSWSRGWVNLISFTWQLTCAVKKKVWSDESAKCSLNASSNRGKQNNCFTFQQWEWICNKCLLLSAKNIFNWSVDYHQNMSFSWFAMVWTTSDIKCGCSHE